MLTINKIFLRQIDQFPNFMVTTLVIQKKTGGASKASPRHTEALKRQGIIGLKSVVYSPVVNPLDGNV
ncbi:hypothetical protein, partial [Acinetobacter baumannii]|uniref:hypothetical protein n=1 Tax=Acinetobacter baumannii TaxID=470 RepID=UPI001C0753F6